MPTHFLSNFIRTARILILLLAAGAVIFTASCGRPKLIQKPAQGKIESGDILDKKLVAAGLQPRSSSELIKVLTSGTDFKASRCAVGDTFEVSITTFGTWMSFRYNTQGFDYYEVKRNEDGTLSASKLQLESKKEVIAETGTIQTSLWESMIAAKIPPEVIMSFTDIFQWEIDFLTEPRVGDKYKLIREQVLLKNGKAMKGGRILAGQYIASGQIYDAVLFTYPDGSTEYFTPKGGALKKAFLKAPLSFRRISSGFTKRRFHPVLKYYRPHLGIDYAAASGTPVDSIGDGFVAFAGWKGGFGKQVIIRHANGYVTYYGHLSKINVKTGNRVAQGQMIGRVGSTGLSSGPHLDFRISLNGSFMDFRKLKTPSAKNLPSKYKEAFRQQTKSLLTKLAEIR